MLMVIVFPLATPLSHGATDSVNSKLESKRFRAVRAEGGLDAVGNAALPYPGPTVNKS